jgi:DNA (cytosine-5)-methyltransferase 1
VKVGSLCTGYGGLDMAVGGDLAWVCDFDKGAAKILAHRYPDVPNLHDLTVIDWSEVEPVDVITAGFPCQPFSYAGKRKGTTDERHLWPYIADALRVLQPRFAVFENVPGLLRLGLADVLSDLAEIGFDAEWTTVRASDVGAPHRRERLFIVAVRHARHNAGGTKLGVESEDPTGGATKSDRDATPDTGSERLGEHAGESPTQETGSDASDELADHRGVRAHRDGRAVAPDTAGPRRSGRQDPGAGGNDAGEGARGGESERGSFPSTPDTGSERHGGGQDARTVGRAYGEVEGEQRERERTREVAGAGSHTAWGGYGPAVNQWEQTLGRPAPNPTITGRTGRPVLNPPFVEWMMGLPEGWVTDVPGLSRVAQLKALGNGVAPAQAVAALTQLWNRGSLGHKKDGAH